MHDRDVSLKWWDGRIIWRFRGADGGNVRKESAKKNVLPKIQNSQKPINQSINQSIEQSPNQSFNRQKDSSIDLHSNRHKNQLISLMIIDRHDWKEMWAWFDYLKKWNFTPRELTSNSACFKTSSARMRFMINSASFATRTMWSFIAWERSLPSFTNSINASPACFCREFCHSWEHRSMTNSTTEVLSLNVDRPTNKIDTSKNRGEKSKTKN